MKAKLKKFYADHKELIVGVSSGIALGSTFVAVVAFNKARGNELADISLYTNTETDKQFLNVVRKNGTYTNYVWTNDK